MDLSKQTMVKNRNRSISKRKRKKSSEKINLPYLNAASYQDVKNGNEHEHQNLTKAFETHDNSHPVSQNFLASDKELGYALSSGIPEVDQIPDVIDALGKKEIGSDPGHIIIAGNKGKDTEC